MERPKFSNRKSTITGILTDPGKLEQKYSLERIPSLVGRRAKNIYLTRQLLCSEAILLTVNKSFHGGLSDEMAIGLASGFSNGLSGSGCLCGAIGGATLGIGLFLGRTQPFHRPREVGQSVKALHEIFKKEYGSVCCRVLTKHVKSNPRAHFKQCSELTAFGAQVAAKLILDRCPKLAENVDMHFLSTKDSYVYSKIKQICTLIQSHIG